MELLKEFSLSIIATIILWLLSSVFSVIGGILLAIGKHDSSKFKRRTFVSIINVSRAIPSSFWVLAFGLAALRFPKFIQYPIIFVETDPVFQNLAWAIMIGLAFSSSGHLAEIFSAAYQALGINIIEQITVSGVPPLVKLNLIAHEIALATLPPLSARLIHQLHITAFVALFPVYDLFTFVQEKSSLTFRVWEFTLLGCITYIGLSGAIWISFRTIEYRLSSKLKG